MTPHPLAQAILSWVVTLGFFVTMFAPAIFDGFTVDEAMKQTVIVVFVSVVSFFFGTSVGSAKKDETIAQQARNNAPPTEPMAVKIDTTEAPVEVTETPAMSLEQQLAELLEREEGRVPYAYKDSKGYLTIGVGRLIDNRRGGGLSDPEITMLLNNDIRSKTAAVLDALPWAVRLTEPRLAVLVAMAFQMGLGSAFLGTGLLGFRKTLAAIRDEHYSHAAENMRASKWARVDSPARARRMADQLESGEWN